MPNLFDPLTIKDITIRNRIGVSPMCQYSSDDGVSNDWHLVHLGSRAVGGAGLIIVEATAVEPRGRISPGDAGLWDDKQVEPLLRINHFLKKHGAVAGIQLAHAGRKASAKRPWDGDSTLDSKDGGWDPIAPSALAFGAALTKVPHELSITEIQAVQNQFVSATKRALTAGYEFLELHGAHGYLAHNFYSPLSNKRTDQYGGSFENRIRYILETARAMRAVWPERLPFAVRLSCSDWVPGGWSIEDTISLSQHLKKEGVDLIDCSSGANTPDYKSYPIGASWQVPFAERIKKEAHVLTAAVGVITDPKQADEIVRNGRADIVLLGRELLRNPYWPVEAAKALRKTEQLKLPIQYSHWLS